MSGGKLSSHFTAPEVMHRLENAFWILLVCCAFALRSSAQISTATMTGTVTDPQGAPVEGVKVLVIETNTNFEVRSETNAEGLYRIQSLQPGTYDVTFEAPGFKALVQKG